MKFKSILGFCSCKGCHKRYVFDVEVKAGDYRQKIRLCEEHAKELTKGGVLKSMILDGVRVDF